MKQYKYLTAGICAAILATFSTLHAAADTMYLGDVDLDNSVAVADIVLLQKHLLGIQPLTSPADITADLNRDNAVDVFDLGLLKRAVLTGVWNVYESETTPTEPIEETTEELPQPSEHPSDNFITAPLDQLYGSMPSQGNSKMAVFYVDFPDCQFDYDPSVDELTTYCFGTDMNETNSNYPFNSMRSFYANSSKGALDLTGQVFRYTAKQNVSVYNTDQEALLREIAQTLDDSVDFSEFDSNNDGMIDVALLTVPTKAGDDYWWPCAGQRGITDQFDGVTFGHVIIGNAEVASADNYKNFVSSYLHEMGHCMGLPDYYLYNSDDYDSMHGNAGTEMMDADAYSDFGCFSKLMLGWYRENQVQVFDKAQGTQIFTLANAQTDNGNCVILPCGDLNTSYFSEYMMLEYVTPDGCNTGINRDLFYWQSVAPGIRVYHIRADMVDNGWWRSLKYENGSEYCGGDDDGIRLIRLANDAEGGSVFTAGDVIDSNISGFHWYADDESESIETGYSITVGELTDEGYTITVSAN